MAPSLPTTEEEQLYLAIADGGYLVAAGDGIVRECGADLAERVGVSVGSAVGRPVTELLPARAGDSSTGFARALDGPDRDFAVAAPGGAALRARVIPVPLTLGWEVTALLGDLGVRDTETWSVGSLRAQHGPAMDAIRDSAPAEAGARLAGILVVVRPPDGEQLHREGIAERRARRAAAALEELATERDAVVAAVGAPAPSPAAPTAAPDDGLADLVEQARELRRRLDDAEAAAASAAVERDRVRAQCEAALGALDSVSAELEDAHRERDRLRAEHEEATRHREALHADGDEAARARDALRAQLEAAETERDGLAGRLAEATAHAEALAARVAEAAAHGEALQAELAEAAQGHARLVDERDGLLAERDGLLAERDTLAGERGALVTERDGLRVDREALVAECEELAAERDALLQERDAARSGAADAGQLVAELDQVRAAGTRLRDELDAVHAELEQERAAGDQTGTALEQLRAELEQERGRAERREAEQAASRAELEAALRGALDDLAAAGAERDAAARRVSELTEDAARVQSAATTIRTELGLDRPAAQAPPPVPAAGADPSARAALPTAPGRAYAVVGPDGCFARLDDAFCSLLGYREHDLKQAGWPSIIDSDNAREHRELARALRAGELAEAEVQTFYMHACGLLVGVGAHVTPSRVPGLDTDHLLVEIDVTNAAAPAPYRP